MVGALFSSVHSPHTPNQYFTKESEMWSSWSYCQRFSLDEIKKATSEFAETNIVGTGGFGNVYRGHISGNRYTGAVAVKRLNQESSQGIPEFQNEVGLLFACHHANIISLVGYCDEKGEKILVYEFMTNGSLYRCLYEDRDGTCHLTVEQRLNICIGVAQGLHCLHAAPSSNIVHSDVKTDNILLDDKLVAKISDLGLSRTRSTGPFSSEQITKSLLGTDGYVAPECYRHNYKPSRKADVYAFGVVLLEVLCERPAWEGLAGWALPSVMKGKLLEITTPYVKTNMSPECSETCEFIISDCLETDPVKRPDMTRVVAYLRSALRQQERKDRPLQLGWTNPKTFLSNNNRIVLYYTSMRAILKIYTDCEEVRDIVDEYGEPVDERDLYLDSSYRKQMQSIFQGVPFDLPQLFVGGNHIGGAHLVRKFHRSGILKQILKPVQK